jgi:hypothetical protein
VAGDLNSDGDVDVDDFSRYLSGLHANLSGLTAEMAFARGDLNGDLVNNFADFVLFRAYYDLANGAGAFQSLDFVVPEPSGWVMVALSGVLSLVVHSVRICEFSAAAPPRLALNVVPLQSGLSIHERSRC